MKPLDPKGPSRSIQVRLSQREIETYRELASGAPSPMTLSGWLREAARATAIQQLKGRLRDKNARARAGGRS